MSSLLLAALAGCAGSDASTVDSSTMALVDAFAEAEPDGSVSAPDGSTDELDGSASARDGSTDDIDGSASARDGSTDDIDGSASAPDGSANDIDGSASAPDGSANDIDGSASAPDGSTMPAFVIDAGSGTLVERGAPTTFSIALAVAPSANVVVAISSSDASEASATPASLTFTSTDWATPRTVTVAPIDDWEVDGTQDVSIVLDVTSADPAYAALDSWTAAVLSTADDDTGSGYRIRTTYAEGIPFYLAHSFYHSMIAGLTDTTNYQQPGDFEWRIVPGLADPSDPSLVSFVSPSFPGRFLRVDGANPGRYVPAGEPSNYSEWASQVPAAERTHLSWLDPFENTDSFKRDATFRIVPARNGDPSMVSLQWYGDSNRYLRHYYYQIFATPLDGTPLQDADASFHLEPLGFLVARRADPHITHHTDGYYYMTASVPEYDRIEIRRATTLRELATAEPTVVWSRHTSGPMAAHIWAPELHFIDGNWYIYFAAGSSTNVWAIRMYVLESSAANPLEGQWTERGQITTSWETFSLDATTFELDGTRYLLWAQEDPDVAGDSSSLFIAAMSNPWTITGTPVRIAQPEYEWERRGYAVNEGPAVLVRNGRVFVSYSASATDANYCLGLLTASVSSDLLTASSWSKSPAPVFTSANGLFGPGHNSFTTSQDGSLDVIVYHARNYAAIVGEPLYDGNRHTRVQRIDWNPDGTPRFGEPLVNGFDTLGE